MDTLVKNDLNSLTTYAAFQTSLTAAISGGGGGSTPGIVTLMKARLAFFNTTNEYKAVSPNIGNYVLFPENPVLTIVFGFKFQFQIVILHLSDIVRINMQYLRKEFYLMMEIIMII